MYEYVRMPFGIKNAEHAFQHLMDTVFQKIDCVFAYLYNILVASSSYKEHLNDLQTVANGLKALVYQFDEITVFSVSAP